MADFTIELYKVLEFTGATLDDKGDYQGGNIGLGDYPIFNEAHRSVLNRKIINRYLNREIGLENIPRFQHAMRRLMHEIMPAYNELYKTTEISYDILSTIDMTTESQGNTDTKREGTQVATTGSEADGSTRTVNSDYPQFMLNEDADYATSASDANQVNTVEGEATNNEFVKENADSTQKQTVKGYQGHPADLIQRARDLIINIDLAIVEDVRVCFMVVWENGVEWTPRNWKGNI